MKGLEKSAAAANKGIGNIINSLKRIAMYRILRTIIKEIGVALKEGSENAYFFSKSIGGDLAQALDTLSTKNYTLTNQFGAAWATLLQTIQPILLQIIAVVTRVMQIFTQFFAVLGGKSTYLKAIDYSKDWADATASGAAAAKEWKNQLLGFDEINKLEAPSDGGSGSGKQLPDYSKMFEETQIEGIIQKIKDILTDLTLFASGAALGIGLFLVFSGTNIPLGLAFIAAGAYGIAKSVGGEGFSDVLSNVFSSLQNLMTIAFGAAFGIGLLLTFSGVNVPLGLSLMAVGALGMANVLAVTWDAMPQKIKFVIAAIDAIISASLLAVGAVLALSGAATPLGIALMAASVAGLAGAYMLSWDELPDNIKSGIRKITDTLTKSLLALGLLFLFVPGMRGFGIGLLIAGGVTALASAFAFDPEGTIQAILHPLETLKAAFWDLWGTVVQVWNEIIGFFNWLTGASASNIANAEANGSIYLTGFASGGFPEDGLFMANHGELVGQFSNGKTAVVNNNQIIEGVAEGVAEAVSSVLSGMQMNSNQPINVRVYLDSREIKTGQQRLARASGSA